MINRANLVIRFREKIAEKHGSVNIGRASIPLHLTEEITLRDNSVKMCKGWQVKMTKDENFLVVTFDKLSLVFDWDVVEFVKIVK